MVLVNNQHGPQAYMQLRHAEWHGLTFTDLTFANFEDIHVPVEAFSPPEESH